MAVDKLKYPRRKKRVIAGKKFNISEPTSDSSKKLQSIKANNTNIEVIFKNALRKSKIKYRTGKHLYGKPDIKLYEYKAVVFCDGDFWHGYNYEKMNIKNNKQFWLAKIKRNMDRDVEVNNYYIKNDYQVFRFWEHEIKNDIHNCIKTINQVLNIN